MFPVVSPVAFLIQPVFQRGWKKWPAGETSRPKTNMENLLKTHLSQYSNGRKMVVTERSHSVMIQNRTPFLVR